ncbi:MAG: hypothetical protein ACODAJ_00585 [Planctomycetota bacterium]
MTVRLAVVSLMLGASAVLARETLDEFSWEAMRGEGQPSAWKVVPADASTPFARLIVENPTDEEMVATVLTVPGPPVERRVYALSGRVRCTGVQGKGYLEMWSHFPGGRYYSRTMAPRGPLRALRGTQDWRRFVLPFHASKGSPTPEKLVLNVVLPARGRVTLGPVRLEQFEAGEDPLARPGQWWGERAGGLLGGLVGAAVGCLGAVIGILGGAGKARHVVLGAVKGLCVFGLVALVVGGAALIDSQPYAVYYPLLLVGVICTILPLGLLPGLRKRYQALEMRQMAAQDMA